MPGVRAQRGRSRISHRNTGIGHYLPSARSRDLHRKSDARWRASLQACFGMLRPIVEVKEGCKGRISKNAILRKTSKHILFLEQLLSTLLQEKAEHLESLGQRYQPSELTLQHYQQQFIALQLQQQQIKPPARGSPSPRLSVSPYITTPIIKDTSCNETWTSRHLAEELEFPVQNQKADGTFMPWTLHRAKAANSTSVSEAAGSGRWETLSSGAHMLSLKTPTKEKAKISTDLVVYSCLEDATGVSRISPASAEKNMQNCLNMSHQMLALDKQKHATPLTATPAKIRKQKAQPEAKVKCCRKLENMYETTNYVQYDSDSSPRDLMYGSNPFLSQGSVPSPPSTPISAPGCTQGLMLTTSTPSRLACYSYNTSNERSSTPLTDKWNLPVTPVRPDLASPPFSSIAVSDIQTPHLEWEIERKVQACRKLCSSPSIADTSFSRNPQYFKKDL